MNSSIKNHNTTLQKSSSAHCARNLRCASRRLCLAKLNAVSAPNGSHKTDAFSQLVSLPYSPRKGEESPKCVAASIEILENEEDTVLSIQVPDYPGLLRVISWVLNGMDLRVKSASLQTEPNGMAHDVLTITNMREGLAGAAAAWVREAAQTTVLWCLQLTARAAQEMVDRLQDFVMYCSPSPRAKNAETMSSDGVKVCNQAHERFTVITITESADHGRQGFLLDVASMLSGVGLSVMEAEITPGEESAKSRIFTFLVCDEHGAKLSASTSGTVIYILSLLMGKGHAPLVVPSAAGYVHLVPDSPP